MSRLAMIFGGLLVLLGVGFFLYTSLTPEGVLHFTALIPCIFGVLLLICGGIAMNEKLRMHAMHGAALVGVLGALGGLGMGLPKLGGVISGSAERPLAVIEQLIMGLICVVFVVLCVQSFIQARKNRTANEAKEDSGS